MLYLRELYNVGEPQGLEDNAKVKYQQRAQHLVVVRTVVCNRITIVEMVEERKMVDSKDFESSSRKASLNKYK